jgi:2,4-dienoyl-CoA reductase-like NADH-dependent reductase (Old Yellow Enzyme family)
MGRALLREPDLLHRIRSDANTESACVHCNECMPTIYSRTRCVLRLDQLEATVPDTSTAGE